VGGVEGWWMGRMGAGWLGDVEGRHVRDGGGLGLCRRRGGKGNWGWHGWGVCGLRIVSGRIKMIVIGGIHLITAIAATMIGINVINGVVTAC
jgi:hypothetical protein